MVRRTLCHTFSYGVRVEWSGIWGEGLDLWLKSDLFPCFVCSRESTGASEPPLL